MSDHSPTTPLSDFDLDESKALVSLAFLLVEADHEVSDEELDELNAKLSDLPFPTESDLERMLARHGERVHGRVLAVLNDDERRLEFIEKTVDPFQNDRHARAALHVLADIAYSDDIDPSEKDVFFEIGDALGVDEDAVEHLLLGGGFDHLEE